jgi:transcriptional regulator with XRE-family HTH domain
VDDLRLGAVLRAIRHRRGWRQRDLAEAVGVHRSMVSRVERGHADDHTIRAIRDLAASLDIRIELVPRWRGADLERLINAGHARLHEQVARLFAGLVGWVAAPEVSFSIFGERGIVDLLAWHEASGALLVVELKTDIVDVNELIGTIDRKRRLAPRIGQERGWAPAAVGSWVVVTDSSTNRRRVEAHRTLLRSAFPADGRTVSAWLRQPSGSISGLSFLSAAHGGHGKRSAESIHRVRRASEPTSRA